jgi:phosphoribosylpyrophosphate synthetase
MFVGSFTLVLPYFPTGTAERVEAEGDVATAVTLARILSHIPLSRGGPTSVVIFDIHALQERFYFGDTVLPLFESGIPLLRARLASLPDRDAITIAYPDEGAWKRFHYQFGDYPEVICTKVRRKREEKKWGGGGGEKTERASEQAGMERESPRLSLRGSPPLSLSLLSLSRSATATSASSASRRAPPGAATSSSWTTWSSRAAPCSSAPSCCR